MSFASPVFEQHYKAYLRQMADMDFEILAPLTGGRAFTGDRGREMKLFYFNQPYRISAQGITDESGQIPAYDTCTILCRYLIMARNRGQSNAMVGASTKDTWANFRDLKDSGPLTVYFKDNVETAISDTLAGRFPLMPEQFGPLSPVLPNMALNYDVSLIFKALPMVPILVLANGAEDGFPAACSVLFRPDVEKYLDAECIAMVGHHFSDLIRGLFGPD